MTRRRELTPEECAEQRRHMEKLRSLSATLAFHRQAADRARVGRDFFIVGAWRIGVPISHIARAAGVHYSRVRQLIEQSEEVRAALGTRYGEGRALDDDDDDDDDAGGYPDPVHDDR